MSFVTKKAVLRRRCGSIVALAAAMVSLPAYAQSSAPASQAAGEIGDIIVTAQRRAENLQNVPIAVTALNTESLAQSNIINFTALQTVTPGLMSQGSNGNATPFIRGVGALSAVVGNEAPVASYIDGVYISSKKANLLGVTDSVERIEVLRGPQGTLFGRNSTGGAIRVMTKDPSQDFSGSARLEGGSFNRIGGQFYVTGGLGEGISANIAAAYSRADGYIENLSKDINGAGDYVGEAELFTVRAKLKIQATDALTLLFAGDYTFSNRAAATAQTAVPGFLTVPQQALGVSAPLARVTYKPRTYVGTDKPISKDTNYGFSLTADLDLGFATLTSLTSYRNDVADNAIDLDLAPLSLLTIADTGKTKSFQQELRLASDGSGALNWQGGLFYLYDNAYYDPNRTFLNTVYKPSPAVLAGSGPTAMWLNLYSGQTIRSIAAFGEASYKFGETTITLGLRGTRDDVTFDGGSRQTMVTPNATNTGYNETTIGLIPTDITKRFEQLTYRANISHRLGSEAMVYASYNRGFKSGVFNISGIAPGNQVPTNPETVDAFEVGAKLDLFDRHLRLNMSAFYNKYNNMQVQVTDISAGGQPRTENAASAKIYGLEIEANAKVSENLSLFANFAYLNARYEKYDNASVYSVVNNAMTLVPRDLNNVALPYAPDYTFTVGGAYTVPLSSGAKVVLDGSWYYNSGYCIESGCLNIATQKAFSMATAGVTYTAPGGKYWVKAFGRNLLNQDVISGTTVTNFGVGVTWQEPATVGAEFGVRF